MQKGLLFLLALVLGGFAQENYLQWAHYKTLTVNTAPTGVNVAANVASFPLLVRLSAADSIQDAQPSGADIRFTKADGITRVKHQIERWDTASKTAEIWVLMDTVLGNNSTQSIRMYWGKSNAPDSSSGAGVFASSRNFVGVWHMAEATGNVSDATGSGNTGLNTGTTTGAGSVGAGRVFSGIGQWITVANSATNAALDVNIAGNYSVSAWFNASNWNGNPRILQRGGTAPKYGLYDTVTSFFWYTNPTANAATLRVARPSTGAWHLAHGTYNGTVASVYVDGALLGSASAAGTLTNSTLAMILGGKPTTADGSGSINLFTGTLDEVRLHSTARDSNWTKLDYETQKSGATAIVAGTTVNQAVVGPSITTNPAPQTVLAGGTAKFGVVAGGSTPLTYKWVRRNIDTVGTNSDTLTLNNVAVSDTGGYKCVVRNSAGQVVSNAANLTVTLPVAPAITSQPPAITTSSGNLTSRIGIVASGIPAPTYKWIRQRGATIDTLTAGGIFSFNTRGDTLIIINPTVSDSGLYRCRAVNPAGAVVSNDSRLTVTPAAVRQVSGGSGMLVRNTGSSLLFLLPEKASSARVSVIDTWGRTVWSGNFEKGQRELSWNWTGQNGRAVAKGVYVARMVVQSGTKSSVLEKQVQYGP